MLYFPYPVGRIEGGADYTMLEAEQASRIVRFEKFEVSLTAGELRKNGIRIRLQDQPFQVLAALLERPGKLVTRQALRERLWSGDTFVDFDRSLNTAIAKIREALGDSANEPRFVETLPRRGYRFIGQIERLDPTGQIVGLPAGAGAKGTISRYRLLEKLGEGGMGVAYKAEDTTLQRNVALKFLAPHLARDPQAKQRFLREARAAASVDHPNICAVHEIDEVDGQTFISMAYIEGQTLDRKIEQGPLELGETVQIASEVALGLEAAHHKGVVHRDIKGANIMISEARPGVASQVKVMDFGLARLLDQRSLTSLGTALGTLSYAAPEQARGEEIDQRADIWSLGVVLYQMVSGRLPFKGETDAAVLYAILHKDPEPLTDVQDGVPIEIKKVIEKALAKNPNQRYQQVGELLVDLGSIKAQREVAGGARAPRKRAAKLKPLRTLPRRRRWAWALGMAAATAVVTIAGLSVGNLLPTPEEPLEPLETVPLTSYPGMEGAPTFSPDGNQVAFSWQGEKRDNWDIYVKLIGPGPPLRLTTDPDVDHSAAWSPDAQHIAFLRGPFVGRKAEVFLVPALLGQERKLAETRIPDVYVPGTCLNWSPDSRWLAVCDADESNLTLSLFLLSVDSGEMRRLTSPPEGSSGGDLSPAFSPDGRTLAFTRGGSGWSRDLYLLDLGDDLIPKGEPRRRTFTERMTTSPVFTSDGRDIVFASGDALAPSLWRVPASGSAPPRRLSFGERALFPAISRRGNRAVYMNVPEGGGNIWRANLPMADGAAIKLISSSRHDDDPRYSPDGKSIAFTSYRSGSFEIWKCDSDGSNAVQLTSLGALTGRPRWTPDGNSIGFTSHADGQPHVYLVSADGGASRRLTSGWYPSWSRDGKWIYFSSTSPESPEDAQIFRMPATGQGRAQVVVAGGGRAMESPDGKLFYFARSVTNSSLWRIPVEGGKESQVIESLFMEQYEVVEDGIYFIPELTPGAGSSIQFLRFATGAVEQVLDFEGHPGYGLSVSPDGRSILYSQAAQSEADIMLVENFR